MDLIVHRALAPPPDAAEVEIVERKGLGHPDTMCDAIAEAFSRALCREYLEATGRVLHHNVDKALLAAGVSRPAFGGGRVVEPMCVILAGRAALEPGGRRLDVAGIAEAVTRDWLGAHLHALDARRDVIVSSHVRPGSSELVDLFSGRAHETPIANDSSCGVGYAPLSRLERLVLAVEKRLNSARTRAEDPALGEDVKVMGFRHGESVRLIVACAMVDGALRGLGDYVAARDRVVEIALGEAGAIFPRPIDVRANVGDDLEAERIYLTVTGTSAEAGDDGQAGRGNRINGLIAPGRPTTIESVAGKNPITHVGKLYNLAASLIAQRIAEAHPELGFVECRMVSAIGRPIDDPELLEVRVFGGIEADGHELASVLEPLVRDELARLPGYAGRLLRGQLVLDDWPLERRAGDGHDR
ncbi:MAG TPA: methionine adenosyltransferase [Myxococcota bacterium]|nr:methionine adenosyltransferase [Myxococcota bacterium]